MEGQNFIIRPNELARNLGVSKPTLWRWERQGIFPMRKKFGPNTVGWFIKDIEDHLRNCPAAAPMSEEEV